MKFVKGDAIAGIVIIVINLLGGLAIGVMQQDMDIGTAMHQVLDPDDRRGHGGADPGAARRDGRRPDRHPHRRRGRRRTSATRSASRSAPSRACCWWPAAICLLMALVPGFPAVVFVAAGAGCFAGRRAADAGLARAAAPRCATRRCAAWCDRHRRAAGGHATALPQPRPAVPLLLRVPRARCCAADDAPRADALRSRRCSTTSSSSSAWRCRASTCTAQPRRRAALASCSPTRCRSPQGDAGRRRRRTSAGRGRAPGAAPPRAAVPRPAGHDQPADPRRRPTCPTWSRKCCARCRCSGWPTCCAGWSPSRCRSATCATSWRRWPRPASATRTCTR